MHFPALILTEKNKNFLKNSFIYLHDFFIFVVLFQSSLGLQNWKLEISNENLFAFLFIVSIKDESKIERLRLLDSRTVGPNNRLPWGKGPIRSNSDEIAVIGWNNMWLSPAILGYNLSDNARIYEIAPFPWKSDKYPSTRIHIIVYISRIM